MDYERGSGAAVARACLKPQETFVMKIFAGLDAPDYVDPVRAASRDVKRLKLDATRDRSVEFFLLASGLEV